MTYRINNQSVEIFEVRPYWNDESKKIETPVAKTTYVKRHKVWKVYWHKSDMKWHIYEPVSEVNSIEEFLDVVGKDQHCCFFG